MCDVAMTLINKINGSLITSLSGGSSSSSASGSSTIGGRGVSASFGGDRVSLQNGLAAGKQAFTNSFLRTSDAFSKFQVTQQAVGTLLGLTDELVELAERASDPQSTAQERSRINSQFQVKRKEFKTILNETKLDGVDLLDKNDLAGVLKDAGIDPEAASFLSQTFSSVAGSDNVVGFARLVSEQLDTPVVITGTEGIILRGTATQTQISGEVEAAGAGVISGQLLAGEDLDGAKNVLFNTTTDYGTNPSGKVVIQSGDETGVGGDDLAYASFEESIVMLDKADNDFAIAVVGDDEASRLQFYDTKNGTTLGTALAVGQDTDLQSYSAAIDRGGDFFVISDGSSLVFGDTSTYNSSGTTYSFDGEVDGGLKASGGGFLFVSSNVDYGGDGSTRDLFFVDGYDTNAHITNVTNGNFGNIALDSVDISSDGGTVVFAAQGGTQLYHYDTVSTDTNAIAGVDKAYAASLNADASGVAVSMVGGNGDTVVRIYELSGFTATLASEVDLNLGGEAGIVEDLDLDDSGSKVAFVVDGSYLREDDEVFVLTANNGGKSSETINIAGSNFTFDEDNGNVVRAAQLSENSGDANVDRVFIDNSNPDFVYFSSVANIGAGVPAGLSKTTQADSSPVGVGVAQLTTIQQDFAFLALSEDGQKAVTTKQLEDGTYRIDLYDLQNQTVISNLAVTDEDPFDAANGIEVSITADGSSALVLGVGTPINGAETITFSDGDYGITTGNIKGKIALSDVSTVFFSDATEFGATDSVFDLIVASGNTVEEITTNQSFQRFSVSGYTLNHDTLAVSQDGSKVATSFKDNGYLAVIDTQTGEVLEVETEDTVQSVAFSDDGSRLAVLEGTGVNQVFTVYQVSNLPGTEDLKVEALYSGRTGFHNLGSIQINGNGTILSGVGDASLSEPTDELFIFTSDENFQNSFQKVTSVEAPVEPKSGGDPLNQDLSTIGGAQIAANTLSALRDEIKSDLGKVGEIVEELRGAVEFALAGARAFESAAARVDSASADKIAGDLVSQIRSATGDSLIGAHSSLDQLLAKQLLG